MMKKLVFGMAVLAVATAYGHEKEMKVNNQFVNIPVSHDAERVRLLMTSSGKDTLNVEVRLAKGEPDYWVFRDVTALKGQRLKIEGPEQIDAIFLADTIAGGADMYREANRPQFHFTTKRGWLNDPNGLVFNDGEFHLFYQHDPFDRDGLHKHWGHAVSTDLTHWQELPAAISPDSKGDIWSGTAVIDYGNTSGFGRGKTPPMVAAYTIDDGRKEVQAIAYSLDNGRTFTKYAGNPVVDSHDEWATIHTRDPKLFRYGDSHWVMVLCERDGNTIYTSPDLKNWTPKSHITGFWECPELFELSVDGDENNKLWVMYGASGTYMLGHFDGETFRPVSGKHKYVGGSQYAAQTFNNIPAEDGRRIQIGWGRINIPEAPFNQLMLLPTELRLVTTKDGVRMTNFPVKETEALCEPLGKWNDLTGDRAEELLNSIYRAGYEDCGLRIKATYHLSHATSAGLWLAGQRIMDYDLNGTTFNGHFYSPQNPTSTDIDVDIFLDRGVAEVFVDGGLFSDSMPLSPGSLGGRFGVHGDNITLKNLELYKVNSIWGQNRTPPKDAKNML